MKTFGVLALVALVGLVLAGVFLSSDAALALGFGWLSFLWRVVPRMTVDWPSVMAGGAAIALFATGVHIIGRRRRRQAPALPGTGTPPWRIGWTLTIVAVVFLLFTAGIALVGITHQIGWLATYKKPRTVPALARSLWSSTNLHEIAIALENYHSMSGSFPAGGTFAADGTMRHGWASPALIFMGYSTAEVRMDLSWNHPENAVYFKCVIPQFINPSLRAPLTDAEGYGLNHYSANCHVLGANRGLKLGQITDGTATTLLAGEINANFRPWAHPINFRDPAKGINKSPDGFGGPRSAAGANFAMADGSVRFISERVDPGVLRALATPAGGETIAEEVLQPAR